MNKVDRIITFLTGEVGMGPDEALSRIPLSVVFAWINLFAEKNPHLRVTRTWYDPSDEWNTLLGVCEDCLPKKPANLTVCEEPILAMCYNCNDMKDYDRPIIGDRYGRAMEHPVKPSEITGMIDVEWRSGHGIIGDILESEEWVEMQKIKSSARKEFCVLVDEEYSYRTHLWWPDMLDAQEVQAWYDRQGYIQIDDLRDWGRLHTVENAFEDTLYSLGLPKLHVHQEDDQYFIVP